MIDLFTTAGLTTPALHFESASGEPLPAMERRFDPLRGGLASGVGDS